MRAGPGADFERPRARAHGCAPLRATARSPRAATSVAPRVASRRARSGVISCGGRAKLARPLPLRGVPGLGQRLARARNPIPRAERLAYPWRALGARGTGGPGGGAAVAVGGRSAARPLHCFGRQLRRDGIGERQALSEPERSGCCPLEGRCTRFSAEARAPRAASTEVARQSTNDDARGMKLMKRARHVRGRASCEAGNARPSLPRLACSGRSTDARGCRLRCATEVAARGARSGGA